MLGVKRTEKEKRGQQYLSRGFREEREKREMYRT